VNRGLIEHPFLRKGERIGERIVQPFATFARQQASGGIVVLLATIAAMVWANSSFGEYYSNLLHLHVVAGANGTILDKSLHFWVNDGLMTIFFFVVGLEIKREILVGELSSFRQAAAPVAAAVGGMLVPALMYAYLNLGEPTLHGWGTPMATDIAFTIGAVTALGTRAPRSLMVFLTALAIADDLGAVLVIALFYTTEITVVYLGIALIFLVMLVVLNILGASGPVPFLLFGLVVWVCVFFSGVHPTAAGILVAMTIPARAKCDIETFAQHAGNLVDRFSHCTVDTCDVYTNEEHQATIRTLENMCHRVEPPLHRMEYALHPWVTFLIVPIFALANAGVVIEIDKLTSVLSQPVSLGILLGLVLGKPVGITLFTWFAVKSGFGDLPAGLTFRHVIGGAALCGIGFTMSMFIAQLGLPDPENLEAAKIAILSASLISFVIGFTVLFMSSKRHVPT
jgi:NhaA family Na+:H+ antiporter